MRAVFTVAVTVVLWGIAVEAAQPESECSLLKNLSLSLSLSPSPHPCVCPACGPAVVSQNGNLILLVQPNQDVLLRREAPGGSPQEVCVGCGGLAGSEIPTAFTLGGVSPVFAVRFHHHHAGVGSTCQRQAYAAGPGCCAAAGAAQPSLGSVVASHRRGWACGDGVNPSLAHQHADRTAAGHTIHGMPAATRPLPGFPPSASYSFMHPTRAQVAVLSTRFSSLNTTTLALEQTLQFNVSSLGADIDEAVSVRPRHRPPTDGRPTCDWLRARAFFRRRSQT